MGGGGHDVQVQGPPIPAVQEHELLHDVWHGDVEGELFVAEAALLHQHAHDLIKNGLVLGPVVLHQGEQVADAEVIVKLVGDDPRAQGIDEEGHHELQAVHSRQGQQVQVSLNACERKNLS